ncbi:MAG: transcription elongation factor GreA [Rickettsiales bacterium]|nr:transcription elongation factor GreA [Rickettsiales bacterium]
MQPYLITKQGFVKMESELKNLKNIERPAIIKAIAEAREHGDLKENAEYHSAKEKQGFIEGRIMDFEDKIARANIIEPSKIDEVTIRFGATVKLFDEDTEVETTYQIVSDYEANVNEGRISIISPLARQLLGKEADDSVDIRTPNGVKHYSVLEVNYV